MRDFAGVRGLPAWFFKVDHDPAGDTRKFCESLKLLTRVVTTKYCTER